MYKGGIEMTLNIKESDSDYRIIRKLIDHEIRSWIAKFNEYCRCYQGDVKWLLTNIILLCILFEVSK